MKLSQLRNGYIVIKARTAGDYEYASSSSKYALGVCNDGKIISSGTALVYVSVSVHSGQSIRSRVSRDGGSPGVGIPLSPTFNGQYIHIGIALESGKNKLIRCVLSISYVGAASSGVPGPQGPPGNDGYTPIKGVDYFDGDNGLPGPQGPPGSDATVTKEAVEEVLTGEISSHSHASSGGLTQAQILTRQL